MKTKEELASLYAKIEIKFVIESLKESEPLAEDTLNWELQRAFVFGFEAGRREGWDDGYSRGCKDGEQHLKEKVAEL